MLEYEIVSYEVGRKTRYKLMGVDVRDAGFE